MFVQRVSTGLLGGFQRIRVLAALNLSVTIIELGGIILALKYKLPSELAPEEASVEVLRRCGWAFVASSSFGASLGIILVLVFWPRQEEEEEDETEVDTQ